MKTTLYKRNAKGNVIQWQIEQINNNIHIQHGIIGNALISETIKPTLVKANEVQSRINAKRKEGYKALEDLYDNAPRRIDNESDLINYLNAYLPKYSTTDEGFVLPMLAKTLEDNKPFDKYGTMLAQWKINGLRCIIGAKANDYDLFNPIELTYHSRTGEDWTKNMKWMDEILLPKISSELLEMMIDDNVYLDGELYLPGHTVNDINSFVKNPALKEHYIIQYWCYDICCENMTAAARVDYLYNNVQVLYGNFIDKNEHLNNKKQFILLPSYNCINISGAIESRNHYIDLGFEGLILRNPNAEYQFGKRNQAMFKFKKKQDGIFEIVDIKEDKRGLPIYTLKNDINDEYFECTINLSQEGQKAQLIMKDNLISKKGLVEYRERSGVKQVPFHAKLIKVYV